MAKSVLGLKHIFFDGVKSVECSPLGILQYTRWINLEVASKEEE